MKPIFKDANFQAQFEQEGFVQLQLMPLETVEELRQLYAQYFPATPQGFHSSSYLNEFERKKEMSEAIKALMMPCLERVFVDFSCFGSAFLTKNVGASSKMPVHQDWTIVDEQQFVAINVWTPLQDCDAHNGGLQVLRGSHAYFPVLRAPSLPFFYHAYEKEVMASLSQLEVKAGEAVVLNQAILHASPPNLSDQPRLAITTGIKSKDAPMQFNFAQEEGKIEVFEMDEDFLLRFEDFHQSIYNRPSFGKSKGIMDFRQPSPSKEVVIAKILASAPAKSSSKTPEPSSEPKRKGFFARLFGG